MVHNCGGIHRMGWDGYEVVRHRTSRITAQLISTVTVKGTAFTVDMYKQNQRSVSRRDHEY